MCGEREQQATTASERVSSHHHKNTEEQPELAIAELEARSLLMQDGGEGARGHSAIKGERGHTYTSLSRTRSASDADVAPTQKHMIEREE